MKENIGLKERLDAMEEGKGKVRETARMKRVEASLLEKFCRSPRCFAAHPYLACVAGSNREPRCQTRDKRTRVRNPLGTQADLNFT